MVSDHSDNNDSYEPIPIYLPQIGTSDPRELERSWYNQGLEIINLIIYSFEIECLQLYLQERHHYKYLSEMTGNPSIHSTSPLYKMIFNAGEDNYTMSDNSNLVNQMTTMFDTSTNQSFTVDINGEKCHIIENINKIIVFEPIGLESPQSTEIGETGSVKHFYILFKSFRQYITVYRTRRLRIDDVLLIKMIIDR